MKKLIYLIVLILVLWLIVSGCIPVPPAEQNESETLLNKSPGVINVPSEQPTIQEAIDAASPGDTIIVAAGTYTPSSTIIINKDNITLKGPQANVDPRPSYISTRTPGSSAEAIIDGGGSLKNIIRILADDVVIDGFEIKSGTGDLIFSGDLLVARNIYRPSVRFNIIHDSSGDEGVQLKGAVDGVYEYNHVFNTEGDGLNFAEDGNKPTNNCIIQYNEIHDIGFGQPTCHGGIFIYNDGYGDLEVEIRGNLIYDIDSAGIKFGDYDWAAKGGKIIDNIIRETTGVGIRVRASHTTIEGNDISKSKSDGIAVESKVGEASTVLIQFNYIYENALFGVNNMATEVVNAPCNWWGDDSGPKHSTNPSGVGNAVSDKVIFSPWIGGGEAPVIGTITITPDLAAVPAQVSLVADFTGPAGGTYTANIDWGDSNTTVGSVNDGTVTDSHTYAEAGVFTVTLTLTIEGNCGDLSNTKEFQYVVVYDPSGGFVTGGGWIDSPLGAYTPDPTLTGPANFGFVSKYKKGQSTPTGNTEFKFKAGNLNFQSDSYDWLVIANHKAMYKGTGTINGVGNFGFMLSAIDEKLTPSTDVDLFRIKIWDKDDGDVVVYDNNTGEADDADPTTAIAGGQIVIHKK